MDCCTHHAAAGHPARNFSLRDEIKPYWSERAESFDAQPGHEIFSEAERRAWHALLVRHLGRGDGRAALDLATGTGVIAHLLDDVGFRVTGLDWAEPMLERATAKAAARRRTMRFLLGDAETTMLPAAAFDVVVTRHLVWTLVDPPAAFAEWRRVLRPGGTLLVVEGDFVAPTVFARLLAAWRRMRGKPAKDAPRRTHDAILSRVHFAGGARAEAVAALLAAAGFADVRIDRRLGAIHLAQARAIPLARGVDRMLQHRYAIRATAGR